MTDSPFPLNTKADITRLLKLNYDVVSATDEKKGRDRRRAYMKGLGSKLFGHAVTAFYLWDKATRLNIPGIGDINFVDWTSIEVLARASTETLTAFNYVYVEPGDDADEADFRYRAWMLAGFSQRVELVPAISDKAKRQISQDNHPNESHRQKIQKTAKFQSLDKKQKKDVLAGRNWHPDKSLSQMCEDVFGVIWGRALYSLMSSHTHSDALSAVQVMQTDGEKAREMAGTTMITLCLVLARMSFLYASKWVAARRIYNSHADRELNEFYVKWRNYKPEDFGILVPEEVSDEGDSETSDTVPFESIR